MTMSSGTSRQWMRNDSPFTSIIVPKARVAATKR